MQPERWQQVKELYCAALDLGERERGRMLRAECREDGDLQSQVESLLAYQSSAVKFLELPALESLPRGLEHPSQAEDVAESVPVGGTLSHYKILQKIGSGGMGVVYKAEDIRLHRPVALKFLHDSVRNDTSALIRLQREAQAASALSHPNICTIYDIETADEQTFVAMEFLDGVTVEDAIAAGPIDNEQLLDVALQIAEALGAAHATGIIHRDVKPANIFVSRNGRVKMLDFGIAKVASLRSTGEAPSTLTGAGTAIGTVEYMSPEQALGKELDARTDLFSFGVVLYEMATSTGPFRGKTAAATFDAILNRAPRPARQLNRSIPPGLEAIISKALEKKPELRYQQAGQILADLRDLKEQLEVSLRLPLKRTLRKIKATYWGAAGLLATVIVVAVLLGLKLPWRGQETRPRQPTYERLTDFADAAVSPTLSPDGRMLAFLRLEDPSSGPAEVYVELLPNGEPVRLTHDGLAKTNPAFSLDGSRIAYTREEGWEWQTWTVPALGGEPSELLPNASALTWVGPREVMFSEMMKDGLLKIATSGESREGERDVYVPPVAGMAHISHLSPDSKWVLVVEMGSNGWLPCRVVPFAGTSKGKSVGPDSSQCTDAAWSPDGKWMYLTADTGSGSHIWRQRFPDGAPEQITFGASEEDGLAVATDGKSVITSVGAEHGTIWFHDAGGDRRIASQDAAFLPTISPDGKTVYYLVEAERVSGLDSGELWAADLKSGREEHLLPGFLITRYRISADGTQIVFSTTERNKDSSVWIWPLDRHSPPRQLAAAGAYDPIFLASGRVVFECRDSLCSVSQDGTNLKKISQIGGLINISPDGKWIIGEDKQEGVMAYPMDGGQPRPLCRKCAQGGLDPRPPYLTWSWDGKWLFLPFGRVNSSNAEGEKTVVVPLRPGEAFPKVSGELIDNPELLRRPGTRVLSTTNIFPGRSNTTYAFWRTSVQRNLYRILIPQ